MLKQVFQNANSVLITSHLGPDYDAYASSLLTYGILKENFPHLKLNIVLESNAHIQNVSDLRYFENIELGNLPQNVTKYNPEIVIFLDLNQYSGYSKDLQQLRESLKDKITINIDHHLQGDTDFTYQIREKRYACVDVLYQQLIVKEGLKIYQGYENTYLTGLIHDSLRFYYSSSNVRESFNTVADILESGYTIRDISDKVFGISKDDLKIISLFTQNIGYDFDNRYGYSYISDEVYTSEVEGKIPQGKYKMAKRYFLDEIFLKVEEIDFCLVVYPSMVVSGEYEVSIRSKNSTIDCIMFCQHFNGGGHITGGGFTINGNSSKEVLDMLVGYINLDMHKYRING